MDEPRQNPPLWEFPLFPPPFGASISWNEVLVSLLPRGLEGLICFSKSLEFSEEFLGKKPPRATSTRGAGWEKSMRGFFPGKRIRAWDWETFPAPDQILGCFPEFYFPTNFFPYKEKIQIQTGFVGKGKHPWRRRIHAPDMEFSWCFY